MHVQVERACHVAALGATLATLMQQGERGRDALPRHGVYVVFCFWSDSVSFTVFFRRVTRALKKRRVVRECGSRVWLFINKHRTKTKTFTSTNASSGWPARPLYFPCVRENQYFYPCFYHASRRPVSTLLPTSGVCSKAQEALGTRLAGTSRSLFDLL